MLLNKPPKYVLLDGASVLDELTDTLAKTATHACLYQGKSEQILHDYAPHLGLIGDSNLFYPYFLNKGWDKAWGVLFYSEADMKELVFHFRKFLIVDTEDGKKYYFRFYDPRVMSSFLGMCTTDQLQDFFGPVDAYVCHTNHADKATIFTFKQKELVVKEVELTTIFKKEPTDTKSVKPDKVTKLESNIESDDQSDVKKRKFLYDS